MVKREVVEWLILSLVLAAVDLYWRVENVLLRVGQRRDRDSYHEAKTSRR